jgi:hypothetical protein
MSRHHDARANAAARRALAPLVASGRAVCPRCRQPILPGQQWDAGHVVDLATGGHAAGRMVPEHRACNRSAGGRLGNQLRRPSRRRITDWL